MLSVMVHHYSTRARFCFQKALFLNVACFLAVGDGRFLVTDSRGRRRSVVRLHDYYRLLLMVIVVFYTVGLVSGRLYFFYRMTLC